MLIKIMTNLNTTKIITDVTEAEVVNAAVEYCSYESLVAAAVNTHTSAIHGCGLAGGPDMKVTAPDYFECFDEVRLGAGDSSPLPTYQARLIDYEKNGQRKRLAVLGLAYVCNDEGKTIAKVA